MLRPTHLLILLVATHMALAGFSIPDPFTWPLNYRTFYEGTGGQQRRALDAIANFKAENNEASQKKLVNATAAMFKEDQEMLKQIQDGFLSKLNHMSTPADNNDIRVTAGWILKYINLTARMNEK